MFTLLDSADSLFVICSQDGLLKGDEAAEIKKNLKSYAYFAFNAFHPFLISFTFAQAPEGC